jgi:hypothetical protein
MGYVYLVEIIPNEGELFYKIGVTKNEVSKRIKQLQTGTPYQIKLVNSYKTDNYFYVEKILHRQYNHVKLVNEWFDLSLANVNNFIEDCKLIESNYHLLKENNLLM